MTALQTGGEEAYAKACGLSMKELDDEMSEIGRDLNLHMDDDRDEIIQRHAEDTVDNADWKDYGGMDHDMEEDLERMRELAGIEEIAEEWNWDKGSYDEKAGYDANFSLWSQEVQKERSQYGDKPFSSHEEMHQEFKKIMKDRGINVFAQQRLSQKMKAQKSQAEIDKYRGIKVKDFERRRSEMQTD